MAWIYWGDKYWGSQYWGSQFWAQAAVGAVYDQTLSVEGVFTLNAAQEMLPPDGTVAYGQTSNLRILWVDLTAHEYIPALAGQFGQPGTISIGFTANFTQTWLESDLQVADLSLVATFDCDQFYDAESIPLLIYFQQADAELVFGRQALQDWEDPFYGPQAYCLLESVNGMASDPSEFALTINPALPYVPDYFYMKFFSAATEWVTNNGDAGSPVGVELLWGDDDTRFVSLLPDKDYVIIQPHMEPFYTRLYDALIAGEVMFKVRGFERFADYSLSQRLNADSAIRIRAYYG